MLENKSNCCCQDSDESCCNENSCECDCDCGCQDQDSNESCCCCSDGCCESEN
ncbi:MAG: hypothetical protein K2H80_00225 [Ureaplasma sp.]|nr:hypothetical protein [Ureaplasma sp.]